jgi:hypothetical protein
MRTNGVRTLAAWCLGRGCNHFSVLDVSGYPDDVAAPEFRARGCAQLRHCGQKLRPHTKESSCGIVETHVSFAILHLDAPPSETRWYQRRHFETPRLESTCWRRASLMSTALVSVERALKRLPDLE